MSGAMPSAGQRRSSVSRTVARGTPSSIRAAPRAQLGGERAVAPPPDLVQRAPGRQPGVDGDAQEVEHVGELGRPSRGRGGGCGARSQRSGSRKPPAGAATAATGPRRPGSAAASGSATSERERAPRRP